MASISRGEDAGKKYHLPYFEHHQFNAGFSKYEKQEKKETIMFNAGKNKNQDPKDALKNASDKLNKGITGGLAKAFMGKDFMDQANSAMDMANQALEGMDTAQQLAVEGADASAEVISIQDSGQTINMNPVVILTLKVTRAKGEGFQTSGQSMVSRLNVPRVGETVTIKYNPKDKTQFIIV